MTATENALCDARRTLIPARLFATLARASGSAAYRVARGLVVLRTASAMRSDLPFRSQQNAWAIALGLKKIRRNALSYAATRCEPVALRGGAPTKGAEADVEREIIVVCGTRGGRYRRNVVGDGDGCRYHPRKRRNHGEQRQDRAGLRGARKLITTLRPRRRSNRPTTRKRSTTTSTRPRACARDRTRK